MSWEDEADDLDEIEKNGEKKEEEDKKNLFTKFNDETEEIQVTKEVIQETIREKDKPVDYEKKYQEKRKADIDLEKEIDESVKYIQDPELRLKKKLELMELKRAAKFLGGEEKEEKNEEKDNEEVKEVKEINLNFPLKVEKDYIDLAMKSAAKINDVRKGANLTLEFLKTSIEELLPTLDEDLINDFNKSIEYISKLKNKEKASKKKKEKNEPKKEVKVEQKSDRFEERKKLYKQYGDGDIEGAPDENDYNDDGDFM